MKYWHDEQRRDNKKVHLRLQSVIKAIERFSKNDDLVDDVDLKRLENAFKEIREVAKRYE